MLPAGQSRYWFKSPHEINPIPDLCGVLTVTEPTNQTNLAAKGLKLRIVSAVVRIFEPRGGRT